MNNDSRNRGKLLARGQGIDSALDVSFKRKYSSDNTVLVVDDKNDLNSKWRIYEKKKPELTKETAYKLFID